MSSEIKANKLSPGSGNDVIMGDSGDKFTFASGSEIDLTGVTKTGFPATGNNTPMFSAYLSSNQNIGDNTSVIKAILSGNHPISQKIIKSLALGKN